MFVKQFLVVCETVSNCLLLVSSIVSACHDIDQWPSPIPGDTLNLPIMGTVIQVGDFLRLILCSKYLCLDGF